MLKRMLRRYTREEYLECVARLRAAIPGLSLTTDIIVGFPGETDEDFEETLSAVREVGFADAFTFNFSPRDGTPATRMPAELDGARRGGERAAGAARRDDARRHRARANLEHARHAARGARREGGAARRGDAQTRTRDFKTVLVPGDAIDARPVLHRGAHGHDRLDVHRARSFASAQPLPMAG